MKHEIKHCKKTGKFCYSSEAKAVRAMGRYEEIRRVYKCDSCDSWHTTKMGVGLAKLNNIPLKERGRKPKPGDVEKRLNLLRKRQEDEESRVK